MESQEAVAESAPDAGRRGPDALGGAVANVLLEADRRWGIVLEQRSFESWLRERELSATVDLAIAFGCLIWNPAALAALDELIAKVVGYLKVSSVHAEDLKQDLRTCLIAEKKIGSFRGAGSSTLFGWLHTITRRLLSRLNAAQHPCGSGDEPEESQEDRVIAREARGHLRDFLSHLVGGLSDEDKQIVSLRCKGWTTSLVARFLQQPRYFVVSRLQRFESLANRTLRARMKHCGYRTTTLLMLAHSKWDSKPILELHGHADAY